MIKYLHDHILEEIEGATDYWEKAVEHKGTEMGCWFKKMAEMELEHANCLTKMFNKAEKSDSMTGDEYAKMQKDVLSAYSEGMGKIESLKKLYWAL